MKIFCVGRNYLDHAKELNNDIPDEPVIFIKPDTALLRDNQPFYLPEFSKEIHHEVELVIRIVRAGKDIQEEFANRYYNEIGIGIDFTARDLQKKLKDKGLPWEKAKAFDYSAPIASTFIPVLKLKDTNDIKFDLKINGNQVQAGSNKDMIFNFNKIISHISTYFTLKIGDLIFTGTPAGVGPVKIGDRLEASLEGEVLLDFEIK